MKKLTETELYHKMKAGDSNAANILAESVKNWAYKLAYRYTGRGIDDEELESIAYCAVAKALRRWDIKRGKLITCAYWSIRCDLHRAIKCNSTLIHYPQTHTSKKLIRELLEYDYAITKYNFDLQDYISQLPEQNKTIIELRLQGYTFKEIGEKLNLTKQRIQQIEAKSIEILKEYYL